MWQVIFSKSICICVHDNVMSIQYSACTLHVRSIRSEELQLYQAEKLTIFFTMTTNVSVVLWELLLNMHTFRLKNNPLLSLLFIESSSGTVKGGDHKSSNCKCSKCHKEPYNAPISTCKRCT